MIMAKKGLTEARLQLIEDEIINASIPYDYDTKEYPVEVIIDKYKKDQIFIRGIMCGKPSISQGL